MTANADISLDWECWDHKPSASLQYKDEVDKYGNAKSEVRVLGVRLGREVADVTPKQLAKAILQGRTWSPFVFNECPDWKRRRRIEALFSSCQVLGVDYDAGDSAEEIITQASQLGIKFNIFHHSFSSTESHPKFRGVIFLEEKIADLQIARLYSTALTYGLGGDTVCVDVARLYFGSGRESVIYLDNESTVPLATLQSLADSVSAAKYIINRETSVKDIDPEWGTLADQRMILARLPGNKREFVKRKILGILREIETFDGKGGASRYECVWKRTSRIARMPETVGNVVLKWVLERIEANPYFNDWDKDAEAVVKNAIAWSFDHAEPPV